MAIYHMRADGTAPNKAAATGPADNPAACMSIATHNNQTFTPGDEIRLYDTGGPYQSMLIPPSSGASGDPLAYRGMGAPKLDGGNARAYCVRLDGKAWVELENLDVFGATSHGMRLWDGTQLKVLSCVTHHNGEAGLTIRGLSAASPAESCLVEDTTAHHNGDVGMVYTRHNHNAAFRRCTGYQNGLNPAAQFSGNIKAVGGNTLIWGIVMEHCESYLAGVDDDGNYVAHSTGGKGLWLDTVVDNGGANPCIMRYNHSHDEGRDGLFLENSTGALMYYNTTHGNRRYGMRLTCSDSNYIVQNSALYNNVSYGNGDSGIFVAGWYNFNQFDTIKNNRVHNNISAGNSNEAMQVMNGADNANTPGEGRGSGNVYSHNCFGPEEANFIEWNSGFHYATYDAWETAYQPTNSVEADPLFTDAAGGDFTLQDGSPCLGAGLDVGLTQDFAGNPVSAPPDVGAHQLSSGGVVVPPIDPPPADDDFCIQIKIPRAMIEALKG